MQGIYALTHSTTGKIYVGSSKSLANRRADWWSRMNHDPQNLPPEIRALTTSRHDWAFSVLVEAPGASPVYLEALEGRAVALLRSKAPERVLNALPVQRVDTAGFTVGGQTRSLNAWSRLQGIPRPTISARIKLGWTPEQCVGLVDPPRRDYRADGLRAFDREYAMIRMGTTILDDNGRPMLLGAAAEALGCKYRTLAKRLAKRRSRRPTPSVTLAELRALTDQYGRWTYRDPTSS